MPVKIVELHHVGIRIAEGAEALKAAKDFYGDILGIRPDQGRPDFPDLKGYWLNSGTQAQVHLMAIEGQSTRAKSPLQDPSLPHVAFAVEDILAARRELEAMNTPFWTLDALGVEESRQQIFLNDPSGNLIELHQVDMCRCTVRNRPPSD